MIGTKFSTIRVLGFFCNLEICWIAQERDQKASFTFGRNLQPKHANRIPRPKEGVSLVSECQGYRKDAWLLRWKNKSRTIVRLKPMS